MMLLGRRNMLVVAWLSCLCLVAGCSGGSDNHAHDDHSHDEHASDHADDHVDDHGGHHHAAPHGGALIPLGDHVGHGELLIDAEGHVTLYLLDGEAEAPVRVAQESIALNITPEDGEAVTVELSAVENVLTSETVGDTSQFEGSEPALAGVDHADGTIVSLDFRGVVFENIEFHYPEGE